MSRPLSSTSVPSNNVLLKITVPKRTGRKRKRGSSEPYRYEDSTSATASSTTTTTTPHAPTSARHLLRTLRDNVGTYDIEPVGRVERTHVFRAMPDFVFSTKVSPFMAKFREQILPFQYDKMKDFDLDMTKGSTSNVDIVPPPALSRGSIPFNYVYRQNPTVKQSVGPTGQITTINTQQVTKVLTHLVTYDVPNVPSGPRENCPPIDTLDANLQSTIAALHELFRTRPAWTRRSLRNSLTSTDHKYGLRLAVPYVGYIFRSGPWRDAIIRFGYDPRTTPDARIYQTFMFRILPTAAELEAQGGAALATTTVVSGRRHTYPRLSNVLGDESAPNTSHLFTGQPPLPRDGKMWMICDITDPILHSLLSPSSPTCPPPRPTCDIVTSGWYGNVTLAKAKAIMRAKIQHMVEHKDSAPLPDEDFAPILRFPDHVEDDAGVAALFIEMEGSARGSATRSLQLASEVRAMVRAAPGMRGAAAPTKRREGAEESAVGGAEKRVKWEDEAGEEEGEEGDEMGEEEGGEEEHGYEESGGEQGNENGARE
ncbi:hypothetical protein AJ80_09150 [Polytolypa hystricis UAMH7299]|uniref:Transcription factor IIIC subunit 5 HTH domain-containing protein n=1 Tax=Polytolypa hystricis (strain UAMH7299) TaxID=1447883 RepID=A0A2B7WVG0_POLH7|nr:hypothetical protein AJ80_09150 [Polytolypa hystricis UAMH7299]